MAMKSIWDARPEELAPGTKLYDAEGNHFATCGEIQRRDDGLSLLIQETTSSTE